MSRETLNFRGADALLTAEGEVGWADNARPMRTLRGLETLNTHASTANGNREIPRSPAGRGLWVAWGSLGT